jgi:proteasome assembly chaperone (PAC2) family protein
MDHVIWMREPRLRNPIMICAFAGWNDAGDAATLALQALIESWGAKPFATIDPEEFTDFSQVRPQVRLPDGVNRQIVWPEHQVLSAPVAGSHRDVILLVGSEPQLRWRTYCRQVISIAERLGVDLLLTMGALLSNVSHRSKVPVMGTATDLTLLDRYDLSRSSYEGPTGIVGVLQAACLQAGVSSASLWATVPSYLSQVSSPKAALALVERVGSVLNVPLTPMGLQIASMTYHQQVEDALANDSDLREMVEALDDGTFDDSSFEAVVYDDPFDGDVIDPEIDDVAAPLSLEHADEMVAELEDFLRRQEGDGAP